MRQIAVWIDKNEAKIFHVEGEAVEREKVSAAHHHVHRHPKAEETRTHNHPLDELRFFAQVVALVEDGDELLLTGPGVEKLRLLRYFQDHLPVLAARVVGIETSDHPTDAQLGAHIRHYFHADSPRLVPSSHA